MRALPLFMAAIVVMLAGASPAVAARVSPGQRPQMVAGDEASALRIGVAIMESHFGEAKYKEIMGWAYWAAEDKKSYWTVRTRNKNCDFYLRVDPETNEVYMCPFGGYFVDINKNDARVIRIGGFR